MISLAAFILACTSPGPSNANLTNGANSSPQTSKVPVNENPDELALVIELPYLPEQAVWLDWQSRPDAPGAERKALKAILLFLPKDSNSLIEEAKKVSGPERVSINTEDWFPNELVSKGELSEDQKLIGEKYSAHQFFREPFNEGTLIRIEGTDYFVVELISK